MVGQIKFRMGTRMIFASLGADLHWCCDEKQVEAYLNEMFGEAPVLKGRSPVHYLYQVAERLGAEVMPRRSGIAAV
ncbi:MAG: hypothetical protein K8S99_05540 [Planctomycetes bacterium]|nr:hypothetical protein [Planctomycetota bacterium]